MHRSYLYNFYNCIHLCHPNTYHFHLPRNSSHVLSRWNLPPTSWEATAGLIFFFNVRLVFPILELHINRIMQYVLFCVQLLFLSMSFRCVVACISGLLLKSIALCNFTTILFINIPANRHLDFFPEF